MTTKQTIGIILVASIILALVHCLSIHLHWYYYTPRIDILLHLLGGFITALIGYYILRSENRYVSAEFAFAHIIALLALVTVGWEVFEQSYSITNDAGFSPDTMSDIMFGIVGGMVGWCVATQ
jgi:hypothetical protein